jgi:chromosome segregation ATPase
VSPGPERQSAAAAAAQRVRAVLEAAEQSAAELRAEAAGEIEAQLAKAQTVAERLSGRADEIERSLQALADSVRAELSALKADLEELRAVGEGMNAARAEAIEAAQAPPATETETETAQAATAAPAASAEESAAAEEPAPEEPPTAEEPAVEEPATEIPRTPASSPAGSEGARVIALNMALNGSTREETAHYLSENFELDDPEALLDEVYARVSS